jgi:hypothetical protein
MSNNGMSAVRGTDAQILKERELTASAIQGAMAFGYQGVNPPPDTAEDRWLLPFWEIGRKQAELEIKVAQGYARQDEDVAALIDLGARNKALREYIAAKLPLRDPDSKAGRPGPHIL